jgi:phosphoglycolate phosphatase-like HAD superfamily hydrolase
MRLISLVLILFLMASAFADDAAAKKCTQAEATQAEKEADSLKDWDQVYRAYKRFSYCDDGAIAEGYSDSVTKLLADDWKSFNRLLVLTNRNSDFRDFVLKHIDESVPGDRLAKIANNARSECPARGKNLCASIAKATGK